MTRHATHDGTTAVSCAPDGLVVTTSSRRPEADPAGERWRHRPVLAGTIRFVVIAAPLVAAIVAGIAAGHVYRPSGWLQTIAWFVWTAAVSIAVLAAVDAVVRRLLPLQRLLQLHLVFPDNAPSRVRVAARAARLRRAEHRWALAETTPADAASAVTQIVTLLGALAAHDRRTRGHSERVCAYTELLADEMELSQRDRDRLIWVALIHDIGKLDVPSRLLNKPDRPTQPEWQLLRAHPVHGDRIVGPLRPWLGDWADAVVQHHERYDGTGYPHGLAGEQLCLGARIIAVADAFEVMTAPRPYRRPVDAAAARSELARHAGTQFDPDVVRHFLAVGLPRLRSSMGLLAWIGQIPLVRDWPRLSSTAGVAGSQAATATLIASSTAGAMVLGPTGVHAAAHDVASAPLITVAPTGHEPALPRFTPALRASTAPLAPIAHVHSHAVTGSTSAAAATSSSAARTPTAAPSCPPPGRGHHAGWSHRRKPQPRHC